MSADVLHRVLVVDDDDAYRRQLGRALTSRALDVSVAANGEEAVAIAREHGVEGAVVDLRMPGMPGLEVVRELLALNPRARVVVLTGFGTIATAVEAIKLGAIDYLQKPARIDEIIAALAQEADSAEQSEDLLDAAAPPSLARAEWEYIHRVLDETGGNISETARRLGLHRRSLQRKLQKYPPRT